MAIFSDTEKERDKNLETKIRRVQHYAAISVTAEFLSHGQKSKLLRITLFKRH